MTGKIKYILILILAVTIADASAQNSQILYYMNLPQNHILNPALRPSNKVYIGLPVLSGFNINLNNNYINFSDVFLKGRNDSVFSILHRDYDVNKFLAKIKDRNFLTPEIMIPLLGIGFSIGRDGYVFLDINQRIESNIVLPGDLFKLALKGNEQFVGSKMDLSYLRTDLNYYNEIGVGYSRNITDKLRIGIKGKLLLGIACLSTDNKSLGIAINNDYTHTLDANLAVNISAPVNVNMDSKKNISNIDFDDERFKTASGLVDFFSGKHNKGFGLDAGATYDLTDRIVLSAAITDLGLIRWKADVTNLKVDSQFVFSGISMNDYFKGSKSLDDIGQDMLDSLKNAFTISKTQSAFTTYLPFNVSFGASYNVTKSLKVGILSYSRIIGKQIREALTLSANLNLGNVFSTSVSYTAENNHYNSLGAGIAVRAGVTQFFMMTDKIPIMWNKIEKDNNSFSLPANWNTINIRFGMNFVFGNKVKEKSDKPMILVE